MFCVCVEARNCWQQPLNNVYPSLLPWARPSRAKPEIHHNPPPTPLPHRDQGMPNSGRFAVLGVLPCVWFGAEFESCASPGARRQRTAGHDAGQSAGVCAATKDHKEPQSVFDMQADQVPRRRELGQCLQAAHGGAHTPCPSAQFKSRLCDNCVPASSYHTQKEGERADWVLQNTTSEFDGCVNPPPRTLR